MATPFPDPVTLQSVLDVASRAPSSGNLQPWRWRIDDAAVHLYADWRRQPGTAIIAVPLKTDDDLIMAHVAVTASLIPGSFVLESDRDRRILYLHVIGVRTRADIEQFRSSVMRWEARIVRAVGTRGQVLQVQSGHSYAATMDGGPS